MMTKKPESTVSQAIAETLDSLAVNLACCIREILPGGLFVECQIGHSAHLGQFIIPVCWVD